MAKIECLECEGTGAHMPDCWLCSGERTIKIEKALAEGYTLEDLEAASPEDDYCRCPADECQGDSCELCEGDGTMEGWRLEHEVTRVLTMAKTGLMPPRLHLYNRQIIRSDELLANFAGRIARDRGWIRWFCSILGDEISLTPDGEREYDARVYDWHRQQDVENCLIDIAGRWVDDGGQVYEFRP